MAKQLVTCPGCGGDGLYKRHTSYTRQGQPFCFRCNGAGKVLRSQPQLNRQTKKQIVGPYCDPWQGLIEIPF